MLLVWTGHPEVHLIRDTDFDQYGNMHLSRDYWVITTATTDYTVANTFGYYPYSLELLLWFTYIMLPGGGTTDAWGKNTVGTGVKTDEAASNTWNFFGITQTPLEMPLANVMRIVTQAELIRGNTARAQLAQWFADTFQGYASQNTVWDIIFNDRTTPQLLHLHLHFLWEKRLGGICPQVLSNLTLLQDTLRILKLVVGM